jgi:threonine synthase
MWQGVIRKYKKFLPITKKTPIITLNEGNTPLIEAKALSILLGGKTRVFLKYEGLNPTGSFKDRGMTVAISKALEAKSKAVMCASTGNTSASASAYASRAGIKSIVIIPEGAIALGKLAQAMIHGAQVIAIRGNFDDALNIVKEITSKYPITLVNSINPNRIEGQKTGAFEICDQLKRVPDYHSIPVGNAGNITAYWKGYKEYKKSGKIGKLPKMIGFQAKGASPIVEDKIFKKPKTIATAIRIGNPASWKKAVAAKCESYGCIEAVTDKEILSAYEFLAREEGVFVEPASAASVAGIIKKSKEEYLKKNSTIVCILTGHGLKDPDRAIACVEKPTVVDAKLKDVLNEIGF